MSRISRIKPASVATSGVPVYQSHNLYNALHSAWEPSDGGLSYYRILLRLENFYSNKKIFFHETISYWNVRKYFYNKNLPNYDIGHISIVKGHPVGNEARS